MRKGAFGAAGKRSHRGFTLIEVMVSAVLLIIVSVGVLSLFAVAAARNNDRGDQGTRTTEYAADKIEQLMALQFSDLTSDVTVTPTCGPGDGCTPSVTNGKGLSAPGGSGGSIDPANTTWTGYYDYIDATGVPSLTKPTFGYLRQWLIVQSAANPNLKTITVQVVPIGSVSKTPAVTTLICQKANY